MMSRSARTYGLLLCLAVVFLVAAAFPAQAQYTKYYSFSNTTASNQTGVRGTTLGLEVITDKFISPSGTSTVGSAFIGGTFNTTVTSTPSVAVTPGGAVQFGWRTADLSCFLRDLRWLSGAAVINPTTLGGVPGGGSLSYDSTDQMATWTISNTLDDNLPIFFTNLQFGIFDTELDWAQLAAFLASGGGGGDGDVFDSASRPPSDVAPTQIPNRLDPGQSFSFTVPVQPGQFLVFGGSFRDDQGAQVLGWAEQSRATPELSTLALLACGGLPFVRSLWIRRRK